MSYYFAIVGTQDNPLFEHEFGTSKQGGDGVARFREEARHMNQFIVHSSLDIVDEVQWNGGQMYLKHIDRFHNNYIFCFITAGSVKFLLLHNPDTHTPPNASSRSSAATARTSAYGQSASTTYNPTAPAVEEAIKNFFVEVYDVWVKTIMNPFFKLDMKVTSPVFRGRVAAAARKHL
ncbi:trafficking protein-like protein particle complex subunit 2 [Rhizodiscina lignyota]|uniref:Trafficking protein-like protein particle complex subunit 2 n=1 Tax=Rhizodiscina lignyota TaxID=1504668 RepID=A0A9P4IRU5_9PEZI|nr:trafficking protein-like protein particle complex subunit 2 [Rhizodiscina lignyota]